MFESRSPLHALVQFRTMLWYSIVGPNNLLEDTTMSEQSFIENEQEREEGHVDTRQQNFECSNPDPRLGCDLGIDVAG